MDEMKIAADLLRQHEGVRHFPYHCTAGKLSIGVGRNLTDRGLSDAEIEFLFENDLRVAYSTASSYPYFRRLDPQRQAALIDMAFQLGGPRFAGFAKMHAALKDGDFERAADECLDSLYAAQVPTRANRIAEIVRTGEVK